MNKIEIWKDIPGYESHYQASHLGNIKSLKYDKEHMLKATFDSSGYLWRHANESEVV